MTVMKGFEPVPDPLDLESFRRLTSDESRMRLREMIANPETAKLFGSKWQQVFTHLEPGSETEKKLDRSEEFARKNGWAGWEVELPQPALQTVEEDMPLIDYLKEELDR